MMVEKELMIASNQSVRLSGYNKKLVFINSFFFAVVAAAFVIVVFVILFTCQPCCFPSSYKL